MTLLGKIFTVLIFVMSVAFCILAVATFATHKNWRDQAMTLKSAVEKEQNLKASYERELEVVKNNLAMEQAARRAALATLQGKQILLYDDLTKQAEELVNKTSALTAQTQAAEVAEKSLADITAEVKKLRDDIRLARQDRDDVFAKTVDLTDKLAAAEALRLVLEERNEQLQNSFSALQKVANAMGFDERTLVSKIPPPLDAKVLAVHESRGMVEISIGSDEGLKKGHVLQVYRGSQYLGQIIVRELQPDRAIGEVDKKMQRGRIREGDNVTTKLS